MLSLPLHPITIDGSETEVKKSVSLLLPDVGLGTEKENVLDKHNINLGGPVNSHGN